MSDKKKDQQNASDNVCCLTKRTFKKTIVAIILAVAFNVIFFYIPAGWLVLNYLIPMAIHHEISQMHTFILENLTSRFPEHKALHYRLISTLNKEWFSMLIITLLHAHTLFAPNQRFLGFLILSLFILVVYRKLFCLNSFMCQMHQLAKDYKKDPEKT